MRITPEKFAELKQAHPRARKLTLKLVDETVDVVIRPANRIEWKAFKALRANPDDTKSAAANDQLLLNVTLFPDPKTPDYAAVFETYPALADTLWSQVAELAGMTSKIEVGE
jgi:hypothetical protein